MERRKGSRKRGRKIDRTAKVMNKEREIKHRGKQKKQTEGERIKVIIRRIKEKSQIMKEKEDRETNKDKK